VSVIGVLRCAPCVLARRPRVPGRASIGSISCNAQYRMVLIRSRSEGNDLSAAVQTHRWSSNDTTCTSVPGPAHYEQNDDGVGKTRLTASTSRSYRSRACPANY